MEGPMNWFWWWSG